VTKPIKRCVWHYQFGHFNDMLNDSNKNSYRFVVIHKNLVSIALKGHWFKARSLRFVNFMFQNCRYQCTPTFVVHPSPHPLVGHNISLAFWLIFLLNIWVYFLTRKDNMLEKSKSSNAKWNKWPRIRLQFLNRTTIVSLIHKSLLYTMRAKGFKWQLIMPYTPQQNNVIG